MHVFVYVDCVDWQCNVSENEKHNNAIRMTLARTTHAHHYTHTYTNIVVDIEFELFRIWVETESAFIYYHTAHTIGNCFSIEQSSILPNVPSFFWEKEKILRAYFLWLPFFNFCALEFGEKDEKRKSIEMRKHVHTSKILSN